MSILLTKAFKPSEQKRTRSNYVKKNTKIPNLQLREQQTPNYLEQRINNRIDRYYIQPYQLHLQPWQYYNSNQNKQLSQSYLRKPLQQNDISIVDIFYKSYDYKKNIYEASKVSKKPILQKYKAFITVTE
jgi:hypothetical protein